MNNLLIWLNVTAAAIIFIHCVCRLSVRQWKWYSPQLFAYVILIGGSVGIFTSSLSGSVHHPAEILINCGMAAYFIAQTWRLNKR